MDIWQKIMDGAYEKWADDTKPYKLFYAQLTDLERKAVALGNLNYQTENGGFLQWIDNGYAKDSGKDALNYLKQINTEASKVVSDLVSIALNHVDMYRDAAEEDWEDSVQVLHDLDTKYYKVNDQLMKDIELWLKSEVERNQQMINKLMQ